FSRVWRILAVGGGNSPSGWIIPHPSANGTVIRVRIRPNSCRNGLGRTASGRGSRLFTDAIMRRLVIGKSAIRLLGFWRRTDEEGRAHDAYGLHAIIESLEPVHPVGQARVACCTVCDDAGGGH